MSGTLYSLGTEPMQDITQLISTFQMYGITVVFDVRNQYEIRRTPGLGKMELRELCPLCGIRYVDAADGFSMDNVERKFLHSRGYVNFEKYIESLSFKTKIDSVKDYLRYQGNVCLLGYRETVPLCHRFYIASELLKAGFDTLHIGPGMPQPHSVLEQKEVDSAFPELDQVPLFPVAKEPYESKLTKTLVMLNKEIGENWVRGGAS